LGNGFAANSLGGVLEAEENEAILRRIVGKGAEEVKNSPDGNWKRFTELHVGCGDFTVISMTTNAFLKLKRARNELLGKPWTIDIL
jgi:hypothetical protein